MANIYVYINTTDLKCGRPDRHAEAEVSSLQAYEGVLRNVGLVMSRNKAKLSTLE